MTKIKSFDRPTVKSLRPELDAALKSLERKFGISVRVGNATFNPENVTFKVEMAVKGANGAVIDKDATAYKRYQKLYGLIPLGETFTFAGTTYKTTGYKPRCSKYPVVGKDERTGKSYKFPMSVAKAK